MTETSLLIPVKQCRASGGRFVVPAQAILASPSASDLLPLKQLADDLARVGMKARLARNAFGPATLRIHREREVLLGPGAANDESHRLTISPCGIEIVARADAGAYYAVQTLRDLLTVHGLGLPTCTIDDWPDFARRGIYHDVSRGKVPKLTTLKQLVEWIARWKLNELGLYIENVFTFTRHPDIGKGYSPFTPRDLLQLQDHCKLHHVRLVGSLATFGHLEKVLALPAYEHLGELYGHPGAPGHVLCPTDPASITFMEELFEEFVPLFEAEDFNVCADEANQIGRGRSKDAAARLGVGRLYADYLKQLHALCEKHGKRMNVWADIALDHPEMLPDLPKDMVLLNWDYEPQGHRIARTHEITDAGLSLVVSPGTNAWGSHGGRLRMGMEDIAALAKEGVARGAEGLVNTDWGDEGHRNMLAISLHNLAYGAAHSWHTEGTRDEGFTERFCRHTFGDGLAGLPEAVRTLGSANETLQEPYGNWNFLYYILTQSIPEVVPWIRNEVAEHLALATPTNLHKHYEALAALRWPAPGEGRDPLLARSLEEFALAARLDMLACLRAVFMKLQDAGETPAPAQLKRLVGETDEAVGELRRVWRLGNKRSRLIDLVHGMQRLIGQYRSLQ